MVDVGGGDEWFTPTGVDEEGNFCETAEGSIRIWAMAAKTEEDKYLLHSVEPGQEGQCWCLHEKSRTEEAERWLCNAFAGLIDKYGAVHCKNVFQGDGNVRRENDC